MFLKHFRHTLTNVFDCFVYLSCSKTVLVYNNKAVAFFTTVRHGALGTADIYAYQVFFHTR